MSISGGFSPTNLVVLAVNAAGGLPSFPIRVEVCTLWLECRRPATSNTLFGYVIEAVLMQIGDLIAGLEVLVAHGDESIELRDITEDSRTVTRESLFIARQGMTADGRDYIRHAVAAGAKAVLCDDATLVPPAAAALVASDVPRATAILAERFCDNPSSALTLIGVTGTNGKTTTSHIIYQLLRTVKAPAAIAVPSSSNASSVAIDESRNCGLIGTVFIDDGTGPVPADLTTPPAISLSRLMRRMINKGCSTCVMEVSSHALSQQRVAGLNFDIGVFTNLSGDHMDYHGSVSAYAEAKARLFAMLPKHGWAVVNADDEYWQQMVSKSPAQVIRCSLQDESADSFAIVQDETITHVDAQFRGPWGVVDLRLPLCGRHNVMNALQAAAVGHAVGLSGDAIQHGLERCCPPPGRLEPVTVPTDPFAVYVDYAHTDDALDNVLGALRPLVSNRARLHVVFGCGGDRDRTKRPRMAAAAWRYADCVYVTSDNPRTENPHAIVDEILTGVPPERMDRTRAIVDRREAIHAAVTAARDGDVVLIAGKGHEDYQIIGTEKRPFDDRTVAREALGARRSSTILAGQEGMTQ